MKSNICLSPIRYREEDFGILVYTKEKRFHVINNSGIEIIKILEKSKTLNTDKLITDYLDKFVFESNEEYSQAYKLCNDYLDDLKKRGIVGEI